MTDARDPFDARTRSLAALIRRVWREIARSLTATAKKQQSVAASDASAVRAHWAAALDDQVMVHVAETYVAGARRIAEGAGTDVLIGADLPAEFAREARNRLVGVGDDVWQRVRAQISLGLTAGEDVVEIAERIRSVAGVTTARSLTIARTETHAAYEAGALEQAAFVDPNGTKTWVATSDERTRKSHRRADGQTVKIDDAFAVGDARLRFPGDPRGGPDESINCRCTTTYDFSDIITTVSDEDDTPFVVPEYGLVAASKKWTPSEHPRGKDGKFIGKGSVTKLLGLNDPTMTDVMFAAKSLTPNTWNDVLTPAQKEHILEKIDALSPGAKKIVNEAFEKSVGTTTLQAAFDLIDVEEAQDALTTSKVVKTPAKKAAKKAAPPKRTPPTTPVSYISAEQIAEFEEKQVAKAAASSVPPVAASVPAGLKGKPGDPAKVTTSLIWGKHPADTVILESASGKSRVIWNGKKYQLQDLDDASDWVDSGPAWTKKDAYAELKDDSNWVVPGASAVATAPAPAKMAAPIAKTPVAATPTNVDFSSFKKIGGQAGSNLGAKFQASDGTEWYVKKPKSEKHAANEVAASALYNLAGVDAPQVVKGSGASALGDGLQTGTKIVPGAKSNLGTKMKDSAYLAQVRAGFAVDAWLANWDVAGLGFDNIVQGGDGKPHRIDVGGALLFRAQGTSKGVKFGDTVTEIDTLRDPKFNAQSAQLFGSMTDAEIAESVKRVVAISEQQIDDVIAQSGLPKSVAATLKKRRQDLIDRFTKKPTPASTSVMTPTPLVADKSAWQWQWEKGLITTDEFEAQFGEKPVGLTPSDDGKQSLLVDAEDDNITYDEAIVLANSLTQEEFAGLTTQQKNVISETLSDAEDVGVEGADDAIETWQSLYSGVAPVLTTDTDPTAAKLAGAPLTKNDIADITFDIEENALNSGDVVAVTSDGKHRVTWADISGSLVIQAFDPNLGEWYDSESYGIVDSFDNTIHSDLVYDIFETHHADKTWLKPTKGDKAPTAPVATPLSYSSEDVIDNWLGVVGKKVAVGSVLALSTDGKYRMVQDVGDTVTIEVKTGDGPDDWTTVPGMGQINTYSGTSYLLSTFSEELSPTWIVPPKPGKVGKPVTFADLPSDVDLPTKAFFDAFANNDDPEELEGVIATGKLPYLPTMRYRLRVGALPSGDAGIWLEGQSVSTSDTNSWAQLATYTSYDVFVSGWPSDAFVWRKFDSATESALSAPSPPVLPAPAVPATSPTSGAFGDDTGAIPYYHKMQFKAIMKAGPAGKQVGYWSKPEVIWKQVKKIQETYPDPNNPGHSLYSPTQILKVLDAQLNTKDPDPFQTKITKWAATAKGSAYIKSTTPGTTTLSISTPNPGTASLPKTPAEISAAIWKKVENNEPSGYGEYDMEEPWLVGESHGTPVAIFPKLDASKNVVGLSAQVKSYDGSGTWVPVYSIISAEALEKNINASSMKLTLASGLATTSTAAPTPGAPSAAPTPSVTPKPSTAPKSTGIATGVNLGGEDISHLNDAAQQNIYDEFKKKPSTYLSSPQKDVYAALKSVGEANNLSVLQMLKVVDIVGAKKVNATNEFKFEKKILAWLKTPQGTAVALGKPIPTPDNPPFKAGMGPQVPTFEASSVYAYKTIDVAAATKWYDEVKDKYGDWTAAEKAGLTTYTGGSYGSINNYYRGKLDTISPTNEKAAMNAQLGMRPSLKPVLLHRGVNFDGVGDATGHDDIAKMVGQTWQSKGFFSTSVGGKPAFAGKPVYIEVEAPPGTPMAWVKPISAVKTENEMVLAAGLHYKIMSVTKVGGKTVVRARVVPDPNPNAEEGLL